MNQNLTRYLIDMIVSNIEHFEVRQEFDGVWKRFETIDVKIERIELCQLRNFSWKFLNEIALNVEFLERCQTSNLWTD